MPPVNDNFAARTVLTGATGSWSGDNNGATGEMGEPPGTFNVPSTVSSIWFEWTCPATGLYSFDTFGSPIVDSVIDVFTGTVLADLVLVWADDDAVDPGDPTSGLCSQVGVQAISGTTYFLRLDGYSGGQGGLVLHWAPVTVNGSATVRFYDPSGVDAASGLGYRKRMVVTVPAFVVPGTSPVIEYDLFVVLPESEGGHAIGFFFGVDPTGSAALAAGTTIDTDALPSWVTYHGGSIVPVDYFDGNQVEAAIWDSSSSAVNYPLGYAYGVDPASDPDWWRIAPPPPAPTITSFAPLSASPGDTVVVTGTNFIDLDRVRVRFKFPFSGNEFINVSFTVDSPTQLHFVVPTLDFGDVTGSIVVTGGPPDHVDVITSLGLIIPGTFGIASVSPSSGPDGTEVTVTGTQFITSGIDTLRLIDPLVGGTATMPFTIDSETQLRFTIPGGFSNGGPYRVELWHFADSTPDIDSSAAQTFTIGGPPSLTSVTPPSALRGASVVLAGINLTSTTAVTVNGTAAMYTVDSDVQITATVPAGAPLGAGFIVVTTPIGTVSIGFEVLPPAPTVSSFSPPSGSIGTTVTVTGTGFDAATSVQVGATHVVFTIVNPTTITFVVPATAVSGPITVTTGGGSATTTAIFGINRTGSAARLHLWKDRG